MESWERIKLIIENERLNKTSFSKAIGITNNVTITRIINEQRTPSLTTCEKIVSAFPQYNLNWILTGEGEMLNSSIEIPATKIISNEEELKEAISKGIKLLPEVDFKFAAGQAELINGKEYVKRYWFLPDCQDCEAVAQISGSSMAPAYPSGCWIALKKYGFSLDTATQIPFGNVFGVVVEDQFTGEYHGHIKVLRRYQDQTLSRKFWIAHSLNAAEFDDFDIEITQVRSLWIVKQHIVSDVLL
jgi:DNA-binding XRE family transcriptional regulator